MLGHAKDVEALQIKRDIDSPALVYTERRILSALRFAEELRINAGCKVLFTLKACALIDILRLLAPRIDGFSASSLFEAKLGRAVSSGRSRLHIIKPAYRKDEIRTIAEICDYVTFNSLTQWDRFRTAFPPETKCGLRINPKVSFVEDKRYDPCRRHSKLGIPLEDFIAVAGSNPDPFAGISGLHFHTNCDSTTFKPLLETVHHIDEHAGALLSRVGWVNIGGGYLFSGTKTLDLLGEAVDLLRSKYGLDVFIEPGAALTRDAGYLVTTVLDIFRNDGKVIAILDTTVNHMPEVFEYQFEPDVVGHVKGGRFEYILAGCSCLAGDVFGEYAFNEPLEVGSWVVFSNVGAYTLVKAHMFNGINLPTIYTLTEAGDLVMRKQFTYDDFASRCGVNSHASI